MNLGIKNILAHNSHLGPMMDGEHESFINKNDYSKINKQELGGICIIYGNCQGKHLKYILEQSNEFNKLYNKHLQNKEIQYENI